MIGRVLEGIYLICGMLCMVFVGEWTYHWTVKCRKKILLASMVFLMGMVLYFTLRLPYAFIFYVLTIVAWCISCEYRFREKIFKIIAIFFIVDAPESIAVILIDLVGGYGIAEEIRKLIAVAFTFFFFYVITKHRWYKKLVGYLESMTWLKGVCILFVFIFGQIIVVFGNFIRDSIENKELLNFFRIVLAMELCAVIGIILWLVKESHQKKYYLEQNALKEEYIRTQQEYYQTIYEKDKEMRSFRHDVANQIGLLQMLMERNDLEGAKEHLNGISRNFAQASFQKVHVGDEMLDAILSMMSKKAHEKGVQIEIEGEIQNQNSYDIYELCAILSNAISNAVEACAEILEDRIVSVKIANHNQTLYLKIENPASEEMYQAIVKEKTTKSDSDNHGYGIRNIRHAVERLNGSMEYRYATGKIALEIYI